VVAAKASTDAPPATSRRRSLRGLVLEVVVLIEILEKPEMGGSPIEAELSKCSAASSGRCSDGHVEGSSAAHLRVTRCRHRPRAVPIASW
jgi:hypothetical protein